MGRDQTKANVQVPGRNDVQQATVETAYRRNGAKSVYNNRCVQMPRELCFGGPHEGDAHHLLRRCHAPNVVCVLNLVQRRLA